MVKGGRVLAMQWCNAAREEGDAAHVGKVRKVRFNTAKLLFASHTRAQLSCLCSLNPVL